MDDRNALIQKYPWLEQREVDFDVEPDRQRIEDKVQILNHLVAENKGLKRHINKRVEAVADEIEEQ